MSCSLRPPCQCHDAVCTSCGCLHRPCGWACALSRRARHLLQRIRQTLTR
jgi:hypothetical protein